ncbi:aspartyl-phosphate phosphatase Spo0E family protein [Alkalihalobacterium chitinilyticum]|uniref:Aspartyl-phosphate phosphatase Spo0E family protein n=1 Tax=Alkalihalobacterium chitinilyticum TaxID=2980103 RepID=A0ABT5VFF2_9BACI|nr:aspartyl-phosphate phosphatase Spo0E family protein [Alkalihalobacterium chitinilyticum]MDE5414062.1 aspartyl-phosphate phosphatase Spo0E family protein [Alkalihalobacterium chitinilyticum]
MVDLIQLETQIEQKRQQMLEYSLTFGISSAKTLHVSQELDELLNQYEEVKNGKKTTNNELTG